MTLLSKLKAALGLQSPDRDGGSTVVVEPAAEPLPDEDAEQPATPADPDPPESVTGESAEGDGRAVQSLDGIGPAYAERLATAGVRTVDELARADPAALAEETGIGVGRLTAWAEQVESS